MIGFFGVAILLAYIDPFRLDKYHIFAKSFAYLAASFVFWLLVNIALHMA